MAKRPSITKLAETEVLTKCRRRCCICFFLFQRDEVRPGQIAHLNHVPTDHRPENLVYLCLEHHDQFDSTTSQSKGLSALEVGQYRERLHQHYESDAQRPTQIVGREIPTDDVYDQLDPLPDTDVYAKVRVRERGFSKRLSRTWHFAMTQVANEPEYFAYLAGNCCDGVCLIERIDLPDGRIVIACIEPAGNPGQSITNAVEELAFQVCERFNILPKQLVWLEHYDLDENGEWNWVVFKQVPPAGPFEDPTWLTMTDQLWSSLWLRPRKRIYPSGMCALTSKIEKLFPWP